VDGDREMERLSFPVADPPGYYDRILRIVVPDTTATRSDPVS
jgi:hypothetical protein